MGKEEISIVREKGIGVRIAVPRNREAIRRDTYLLRKRLGMTKTKYFPILHFIENVLPQTDPEFNLEVVDDNQLMGRQAETIPEEKTIRVKQSVYDAATEDHWWARLVLAHEVGHYYYHDSKSVRYAKLDITERVPFDFDPERQANVFAAELLAPIHLIKGMSDLAVAKEFGLPRSTAKTQLRVLNKIEARQAKKKAKKKKAAKQKPDR